jgi:mono/diheme cytochrome c family protein
MIVSVAQEVPMAARFAFALCALWLLQAAGSRGTADVARGKYLVEEVAQCGMCHTPHDRQGRGDAAQFLQGAPLWIEPVTPLSDWALRAPPLAGLPAFSDEEVMRVLQTGMAHDGTSLRPPMHQYHLQRDDAAAIVAYLRSLPAHRSE